MWNESDKCFLKHIGKVITRKRKKASLDQDSLSAKLKISQATLSRYEQGKTNMPVLSLKRIADECDFDVIDYFIESKTPSRMYKEIVKPEAVDRITEKDRAFDEILRLPQNMDKLKYLYHASEAIQLMQKTDITNYHADNLVDGVNDILIETKTPNSSRNIELLGEYIKQFNQNLK